MGSDVFRPICAVENERPADLITRGARRLIASLGYSSVCELSLPNGRRADIVGISHAGEIIIIEVKSCLADYLADNKWREYQPYCDRFYFALAPDGPAQRIPDDSGLIVADGYAAEVIRDAPAMTINGARRRAVLLAFARHAADRLHLLQDRNKGEMRW